MVGDRDSASGDGLRASPPPAGAAAAASTVAGLMKGAMGLFSPTSLARHKKLMAEEDERREASMNIMGESSQIIGALKAEVYIHVGCVRV